MPSTRSTRIAMRLSYELSQHQQQEAFLAESLTPHMERGAGGPMRNDGPYAAAAVFSAITRPPITYAGVAARGSQGTATATQRYGLPPWTDMSEVVLTAAQRQSGRCAITDVALEHLKLPVVCFVGEAIHVFCWHGLNRWVRSRDYRCKTTDVFKNPYNRTETAITELYRVAVGETLANPVDSRHGERSPSAEFRSCPHKSA